MFDLMETGRRDSPPTTSATGNYLTQFWPRARRPGVSALSPSAAPARRAARATGGRTIVYVNMHAWFGTRGYALAKQVRGLYDRGCYVRVLYSFMSASVFKKLRTRHGLPHGRPPHAVLHRRRQVRRRLQPRQGDRGLRERRRQPAARGSLDRVDELHQQRRDLRRGDDAGQPPRRFTTPTATTGTTSTSASPPGTWATFEEPIGGGRPDKVATPAGWCQPTTPPTVLPPVADDEALPAARLTDPQAEGWTTTSAAR